MIRRLPVFPTLLVLILVAIMIKLGLWQLDRKLEKEAALADLHGNFAKAEMTLVPLRGNQFRFRRSRVTCDYRGDPLIEGAGKAGFRVIASCRNVGMVQLGTSRDPDAKVTWGGGVVTGWIAQRPDHRPLVESAFDSTEPLLMLVADPPVAGLAPNARPDPSTIPNNHLSYAVQWFLFAATALVIYALALRKRWRETPL